MKKCLKVIRKAHQKPFAAVVTRDNVIPKSANSNTKTQTDNLL